MELSVGLDLNGPGDGLVPLADLDQLSIDVSAKAGYELDPLISASLGDVIGIEGEMLIGGFAELDESGFAFSTTPFVFRPGDINLNLGEELAAASGPFAKIALFLNDYFLEPLEPLVDLLETEFSIAGLNLIGDGKLHNLIDLGVENTPNGAVTQWVTLYKGIDSVVDSVAQLQDSDEINVPSWLFLDDDLHTVVAGQDDFEGSGSDPFRTDGIENETRGGSSASPQGVLQDAVDTLSGAMGNGGGVGLNTDDYSSPDLGQTEVTFPFLDFAYTSERLLNLLLGTDPASRYELDLIRLQIQGFSTSWSFDQSIGPIYTPPSVNIEVGASITRTLRFLVTT